MDEIIHLLEVHYGLAKPKLSPAARGFVAETYIVENKGRKYFAKVLESNRYSENVRESLPILKELYALGIANINYPVETKEKGLHVQFNSKILILFNFIDGEWTFDYEFEKYVSLLADIHLRTPEIKLPLKKETFNLPFLEDLEKELIHLENATFSDPLEQELQTIVSGLKPEVLGDIKSAIELASNLKNDEALEFYLTHGDAPGNIIKTGSNDLYLIDWDDMLSAPLERDTWFHLDDGKFLGLYQSLMPSYRVHKQAYSFYAHRRYLDDLEGWISKILASDATLEQKEKNLAGLKKDTLEWMRPIVRRLSGNTPIPES